MRILNVVASASEIGGGLAEAAAMMSFAEASHKCDVTLASLDDGPVLPSTAAAVEVGTTLVRCAPSFPNAIRFSLELSKILPKLVRNADVVCTHGQWTFPVWCAGRLAVAMRKKFVAVPSGSFNPVQLRHSSLKKRLASIIDFELVRNADIIQVSSEAERSWVLALPNMESRSGKVKVIAPCMVPPPLASTNHHGIPRSDVFRLLYLGRIHPMKGIDLLIDAMKAAPSHVRLSICGPDGGAEASIRAQVDATGIASRVEFLPAIHGDAKWSLIRSHDCLVLPSRSENFGFVVPEALACGIPVIATNGTPWHSLLEHDCGWYCETDPGSLAAAICAAADATLERLAAMGRNGAEYVTNTFTPDAFFNNFISALP